MQTGRAAGTVRAGNGLGKRVRRRGARSRVRPGLRSHTLESLESRQLLAVVISEFMASNSSAWADNDGEFSDWIELRNTGNQPVNLNGWHLTDDAANLTKWELPAVELSAGGHLLIYASDKDRANPAQPLHANFRLSAAGEYLGLVRPDGRTVEFAYAPTFPPQRTDISYGLATDGITRGFFASPTPGQPNGNVLPESSGAVVINELMYSLPRASILDREPTGQEFVELYNRGLEPVDITGWQFTRGIRFTMPPATIPAQGTLVVAADPAVFAATYPDVTNVVGGWTGKLSNRGETLELVDARGIVVDQVRYADEGDWGTRAPGPLDLGSTGWIWTALHAGQGHSLELIHADHDNNVGQNWGASLAVGGTPGRVNSIATNDIAPLITEVTHDPPLPRADQPVTITARVRDDRAGPLQVAVNWRVAAPPTDEPIVVPFQRVTMFDDGRHGDGIAGDGIYGAVLPGQSDLAVVEFYVAASDSQNLTRTWPAPTSNNLQETNALYQVIDAFDAGEPWVPGSAPIYHVIMTPTERQEFTNVVRQSNARFHATFIAVSGTGIDVRHNTGVRIRGSGSRDDPVPNNRIDVPHDQPWQGVTAVNVNQRNPVDQIAGSVLFRLANVPVSDAHAVRLFSNGIDLKNGGFYVHQEVMDNEYAENHYPTDPNGNLYRGRRPNESPPGGQGAGLVYFGEDPAPYVSYDKSTNGSEADWSDVIELTRILSDANAESFVEQVNQVADIEQWFRAIAVNLLIDNNEYGLFTGDPLGDDYAMYRGLEDTRFQMIPYDWDTLFGNVQRSIMRPLNVPPLARLINHPEFRPEYYRQLLEAIDAVVLSDQLRPTLDLALQQVATPAAIARIEQFLVNRANYIRGVINAELTAESSLPLVDGVPRSTGADVRLEGAYPQADTRAVRVNGHLATLTPNNGRWRFSSDEAAADTILPFGAVWSYHDQGTDLGNAWRAPDYDDSSWSSGPAQLGYGDGDEATVVDFGGNPSNRHPTTYFRTRFELSDLENITGLTLELIADDGAAVYLNGTEVLRHNLAPDAGYTTLADSLKGQETENLVVSFQLPPSTRSALVEGENVLAIEVHQGSLDSPDVSMDARLGAVRNSQTANFLRPGMNRLDIATYANLVGEGAPVETTTYDLWYDRGAETTVSGTLTGNVTWSAAAGPYRIQGDVTLTPSAVLTIEPGTTVFFETNARLIIRGRLAAIGTPDAPIWFTRRPGASTWDGLQFLDSMQDNRIAHAILEYGITNDGMIGLSRSRLTIDHAWLDHTERRRIRSNESSLVVRNSTFTDIFLPDQAPTTDLSAHIWGEGIPAGGEWIVDGNSFGTITGPNHALDFIAPRGTGRYAQILNNAFAGGGDDALDMAGDVYIEGNVFRNYIKDRFNTDPGQSNAISASAGEFWVVRNVFDNVQHASLIKEDAYMYFLQNTVASSEFAPLYFDRPGQTLGPGRGALVQGSIFAQSTNTFDFVSPDTNLQVHFSYLPARDEPLIAGIANQFGSPHVAGADGNWELLPGSTARNRGPNGADIGARIGPGATVAGIPASLTNQNNATIVVGGPGITAYRYQLNDGPLSTEQPVTDPLTLSGLSAGTYALRVWGRNALGVWQTEPTVSAAWTVAPAAFTVRINEVLADNVSAYQHRGAYRDAVELFNFGGAAVNLQGYSLSDRADEPGKFVFPAGSQIGAGQYLVLSGDTLIGDEARSLGFGLNRQGESLYLFDPSGAVVDNVTFGAQLADRSIGRTGDGTAWTLNQPTLGGPNLPTPLGDADQVVINEWFTNGDIRWQDDFVELYNPLAHPIDLSGYALTDEPFDLPRMSELAPLTFLDADGLLLLTADGDAAAGPDHLSFRLSSVHDHLAIVNPAGEIVDQVLYAPQTAEVSQGRMPDGGHPFVFMPLPTPGQTNGSGSETVLQFDWATNWRYNASGDDLGTAWRETDYDDSAWNEGPGLLGHENGVLPEPLRTEFAIGPITFYFRKSIVFDILPAGLDVQLSTIVDDGLIIYVNGREVLRRGMPDGPVDASTLANRTIGQAGLEGPFAVPAGALRPGENVIAVEVHQTNRGSSDLVFGMALEASGIPGGGNQENQLRLLDQLRVTELMYHPPDENGPEYIELQNVGDAPLDLSGVRISGGVDFVFPSGTTLGAGAYTVLTDSLTRFAQTYGTAVSLAGEYEGRLSNGGEELVVQFAAPLDTAMLRFAYDPGWEPASDGGGLALQVVDPTADFRSWNRSTAWHAAVPSPGRAADEAEPGDLNHDGSIDVTDVDLICAAIRRGEHTFDLNGDNLTTSDDLDFLIGTILGTSYGDANLDGTFNSSDFVLIFTAGKYEDETAGTASWAEGDWNCDGLFTSRDLVLAFQSGGYVAAARPALDAISADLAAAILADEQLRASAVPTPG
jgi:hypothetical protein